MTTSYTPRLGAPLGPDSLTWQLVGDYRWLMLGMRAGLLQTMHPAINQALREHDSTYFQGPMKRILRSVPQIVGVVYDADAGGTGAKVRDYHKPLNGRLRDGTQYHALNPDVFYWPHATFFEEQIAAMEFFGTPLTADQKERLFQESVQWYSLYGLSMKPVPANYVEFCQYWDHMIENELEINGWIKGTVRTRKGVFGPSPYNYLPEPLWRPISDAQFDAMMWVTRGTLPVSLRQRAEVPWTASDEVRLRALGTTVANTFGRLPLPLRLTPTARAAYRRAGKAAPLTLGESTPLEAVSA